MTEHEQYLLRAMTPDVAGKFVAYREATGAYDKARAKLFTQPGTHDEYMGCWHALLQTSAAFHAHCR
jgi:hypothetical protein